MQVKAKAKKKAKAIAAKGWRGRAKAADLLSGDVTTQLGRLWAAIRKRHADLPPAVVVLATGSEGLAGGARWGHWGVGRWSVEGEAAGEVLIAGELIAPGGGNDPSLPAEQRCLATLLHEAAHAIASARGVKDTSRQGRYHNERYQALAVECGLVVEKMGAYGWAKTTLAAGTAASFSGELAALAQVLKGHRGALGGAGGEGEGEDGEEKRKTRVKIVCGCAAPRVLYVAPGVLDLGGISCDVCGEWFAEDGA